MEGKERKKKQMDKPEKKNSSNQTDAENDDNDSVFDDGITAAENTSMPAPTSGRRNKRKRAAPTSPRRTRLRSRMSSSTMEAEETEEGTLSMETLMANMAKQMQEMNRNMEGIQDRISASVSRAVEPLTARMDASSLRMDRLERKQDELKVSMDQKIDMLAKGRQQHKGGPPGDHTNAEVLKAVASYASAAATKAGARAHLQPGPSTADSSWYWDARKCLRFFPIKRKTEADIRASLDTFVSDKLRIPTGELTNDDINFVRRTRTTKRSRVQDEVLVSFNSTAARDLVQSHAKNLAEWVGEGGKPLAGIRMEIPERLMSDFKALEQYGHAMKEKHGKNMKRHTKLDDASLCVYLDIYLPRQETWVRVDVDLARKDNQKRQEKKSKKTDSDLLSTTNEDGE